MQHFPASILLNYINFTQYHQEYVNGLFGHVQVATLIDRILTVS